MKHVQMKQIRNHLFKVLTLCCLLASALLYRQPTATAQSAQALPKIAGAKPRNIVLILTDDHRWDAMGFAGHPFVETPHMDALARGGAHMRNAFVTTSLCSPSRASILTGLYAHRHRVVDNNNPVPTSLTFFPQYLQQAGYETGFVGKWHMGSDSDAPQRGFNHWVSFKGQGTYWPNPDGLNINGQKVPQKGYLTDELTDYAVDWLKARSGDKPFMLYLAHKAVHTDALPDKTGRGKLLLPGTMDQMGFPGAPRHAGRYKDRPFTPPLTMALTKRNYADKPMWVQNRRNSRHGVELPMGHPTPVAVLYRQYMEALLAVDDSVGRVMDMLRQKGMLDSTIVIYMGDNGYAWGEHGMVDKRAAYEESMRVPMIVHCPELIKGGTTVAQMVANLDIAPTLLEAAGLEFPRAMDGRSFLPLVRGQSIPWRERLLYEYYWEWNYPMTPTIHALRGERYKYIRPYGVWDTEELYDLQNDPHEITNLIRSKEHQPIIREMKEQLFRTLEETGGMYLPMSADRGAQAPHRRARGSKAAQFPSAIMR